MDLCFMAKHSRTIGKHESEGRPAITCYFASELPLRVDFVVNPGNVQSALVGYQQRLKGQVNRQILEFACHWAEPFQK